MLEMHKDEEKFKSKKHMLLLIEPFRKLFDKELLEVLKLNCQTIERLENIIDKLEKNRRA